MFMYGESEGEVFTELSSPGGKDLVEFCHSESFYCRAGIGDMGAIH